MAKKKVTAEEFIRVWQSAETLDDVCKELEIIPPYASSKASKLRAKGVPLQYFSKSAIGYDWDKLAELAMEAAEEPGQ